jgi:hypothetical protein
VRLLCGAFKPIEMESLCCFEIDEVVCGAFKPIDGIFCICVLEVFSLMAVTLCWFLCFRRCSSFGFFYFICFDVNLTKKISEKGCMDERKKINVMKGCIYGGKR